MDLEYLLEKNMLIHPRTFNPSIIFDLKMINIVIK
jgi:hypothetical protein